MKTAFIVFCSPSGSTHRVAQVIADTLKEKSTTVHVLDLGIGKNPSTMNDLLKTAEKGDCLFVGSPVYQGLAIPPVMGFVNKIPLSCGCAAAPFVTWGGSTSGIALWQMGRALVEKGYELAGAAKVMAVHSMMWLSENPVGLGHPDADDDRQVRQLVEKIMEQSDKRSMKPLDPATLDYQPETIRAEPEKKLGNPWTSIPKTVVEENCTECAICEQVCPVGAVSLDPFPSFNENCFGCFNCVRECPESAIVPAKSLDAIEAMIRKKVGVNGEKPPTEIFHLRS